MVTSTTTSGAIASGGAGGSGYCIVTYWA
jgi:hypothetical protein